MRVVIGADHAGCALKQKLGDYLRERGHEVTDAGTMNAELVDDPDYAEAVGKRLLGGGADRGVLMCGSGVGTSGAANTLPGIRAAVCHDTYSARQGSRARRHEHSRVGSAWHRRKAGARIDAGFSTRQVHGGGASHAPAGEDQSFGKRYGTST